MYVNVQKLGSRAQATFPLSGSGLGAIPVRGRRRLVVVPGRLSFAPRYRGLGRAAPIIAPPQKLVSVPASALNNGGGVYKGVRSYLDEMLQSLTVAGPECPTSTDVANWAANVQELVSSQCYLLAGYDPDCADPSSLIQEYVSKYTQWAAASNATCGGASSSGSSVVYGSPSDTSSYSGGGAVQASASLQNLSRPGQAFQVGDSFQLTIRGGAGLPVSISATQNGRSLGTTSYGSTDSSGSRVITGSLDASTVGTWQESISVGGSQAPTLSFSVSSIQPQQQSAVPQQQTAPAAAPSGGSSNPVVIPVPTSSSLPAPAASSSTSTLASSSASATSFLDSTFSLAGYQVPVWGAGLAAIAALWAFGGRR